MTITGNTAPNGGGGVVHTGTLMDFANTIIAGNSATAGQPEIYFNAGTITSNGNNLVGDSPGDSTDTMMPVTYQPSDIQNMNPLLGALLPNGGGTPTRALLAGSPAIDAGNNAQAIDPSNAGAPLSRDQRFYLRIAGATVDIGAYEFNATPSTGSVSVGGRVTFGKGSVASRVTVSLMDASGNVKTALTNPFGYYKFENVSAGQTIIVQVSAKGATFAPQVVTVTEDIEDLDFLPQ